MDIKVYRYFTALARTKNYARAAKELYKRLRDFRPLSKGLNPL